eukprot:TRINITY_DN4291_c0_g1_i2.p2 TRINITY_DN4291_c0_g1~~TRINITY_DN4291_c0_g1_i2.p2  ORF type:complete len:195 (+),score=33.08 TRINITY_DN4291_c0_g1_i2:263-847(+)
MAFLDDGAATPSILWTSAGNGPIFSSPCVVPGSGIVVAGRVAISEIQGHAPANGSVLWRVPTSGPVFASPVAASGSLVVVGCHGGSLYCIEAGVGAVRWEAVTTNRRPIGNTAAVGRLTGSGTALLVLALSTTGEFVARDLHSGGVVDFAPALDQLRQDAEAFFSAPVWFGQHLLVAGRDDKLRCFALGSSTFS